MQIIFNNHPWQNLSTRTKNEIFIYYPIVVVVICTIGFLIWRNYKYRMVNQKLDKLVTGKSEGLYQISYKNLIINEALGSISASEIDMLQIVRS